MTEPKQVMPPEIIQGHHLIQYWRRYCSQTPEKSG